MSVLERVGIAMGLLGTLMTVPDIGQAGAEDEGRRLAVVCCRGPVSVEAHGVRLARVLGEIGVRAGFSVVDTAASLATVDVSVHADSVDDLLSQLLRQENHTVLYRGDGAGAVDPGIHTIVLLGEAAEAPATAEAMPRTTREAGNEEPRDHGPLELARGARRDQPRASSVDAAAPPTAETVSAFPGASAASQASPAATTDAEEEAAGTVALGGPPPTVEGLLAAHALAAAMPAASVAGGAIPAVVPSADTLPAVPPELVLRAQASLGALIGGLTDAMRSMGQPVVPGPK